MGGCCCCCAANQHRNEQPAPPERKEVPVVAQQLVDEEERRKREAQEKAEAEAERLRKLKQKEEEEEKEKLRLQKEKEEQEAKERQRLEQEEKDKREQINKKFIEELNKHKTKIQQSSQTVVHFKEVQDQRDYELEYHYHGKDNELLGPIVRNTIKAKNQREENQREERQINKIQENAVEVIKYYQSTPYSRTSFVKYENENYFMKTIFGIRKEDVEKSIKAIEENQKEKDKHQKFFPILFYCLQEQNEVFAISLLSEIADFNIFQFSSQPWIQGEQYEYYQRISLASQIFVPTISFMREKLIIFKPTNFLIKKIENNYQCYFADTYYLQNNFQLISDTFIYTEFQGEKVETSPEASLPIIQSLILIFYQIDILSCEKMGSLNTFCQSKNFQENNLPNTCNSVYDQLNLLDELIKEKVECFQNQGQEKLKEIWQVIKKCTDSKDFHIESLNKTINSK